MKNSPTILSKLYKTPGAQIGSYSLRGTLPDGQLVELVCNQHKRTTTDPDFFLLVIQETKDSSPGKFCA